MNTSRYNLRSRGKRAAVSNVVAVSSDEKQAETSAASVKESTTTLLVGVPFPSTIPISTSSWPSRHTSTDAEQANILKDDNRTTVPIQRNPKLQAKVSDGHRVSMSFMSGQTLLNTTTQQQPITMSPPSNGGGSEPSSTRYNLRPAGGKSATKSLPNHFKAKRRRQARPTPYRSHSSASYAAKVASVHETVSAIPKAPPMNILSTAESASSPTSRFFLTGWRKDPLSHVEVRISDSTGMVFPSTKDVAQQEKDVPKPEIVSKLPKRYSKVSRTISKKPRQSPIAKSRQTASLMNTKANNKANTKTRDETMKSRNHNADANLYKDACALLQFSTSAVMNASNPKSVTPDHEDYVLLVLERADAFVQSHALNPGAVGQTDAWIAPRRSISREILKRMRGTFKADTSLPGYYPSFISPTPVALRRGEDVKFLLQLLSATTQIFYPLSSTLVSHEIYGKGPQHISKSIKELFRVRF